eukprot:TRINITY_DN69355_c0_g1_i1.p1 TRINITY_DN69355_c0_g1~~TRINITY_DN69355_c0_g1_i1.p1  ORF type:complete len:179 (-),score=24.61 TRINITY_DN69355_c0_g1_i1:110-646(-)
MAAEQAGSTDGQPHRVEFPAFRSEEWLQTGFNMLRPPREVLESAELSPEYMANFPTVGLYPGKVAQVREQIRVSLFRQALAKVQNVEVTFLDECKEARVLENVAKLAQPSYFGRVLDSQNPSDVELITEELWTVNRCGSGAKYSVRYSKEGANGFSASVTPLGFRDMWAAFKFYYFPE